MAAALESLGRTVGPIWGNGALQRFGEGTAYGPATVVLGLTALAAAWLEISPPLDGVLDGPE